VSFAQEVKSRVEASSKRCTIAVITESMTTDDAKEFIAILAKPEIEVSTLAIHAVLKARDFRIAETTVTKHRRRQCLCFKKKGRK
jgi:hypothetical protein